MQAPINRRARKRTESADLIADTAFRLFEAEGYEQVTMERIAAEADVAKGTLYNRFPVKEALLAHHFHRQLADDRERMAAALAEIPDPLDRFTLLLREAARWAARHRPYLQHYLRYRLGATVGDPSQRSGMDAVFRSAIQEVQASGGIPETADAEWLTHYFQYLYLAAMTRWLHEPSVDLEQELAAMLRFFLAAAREAA